MRSSIVGAVLLVTACTQGMVMESPPEPPRTAPKDCASLTAGVVHAYNPRTDESTFVLETDVAAATARGFTERRGIAFRAATEAVNGTFLVERWYNDATRDREWLLADADKEHLTDEGFVLETSAPFYAAKTGNGCAVPVYSLINTETRRHRLTTSDAERDELLAVAWQDEGIRFYAVAGDRSVAEQPDAGEPDAGGDDDAGAPDAGEPEDAGPPDAGRPDAGRPDAGPGDAGTPDAGPPVDTRFTFIVMPDTQREVNSAARFPRFVNRMQWVKDNKAALDIRYVMQVGDLVDWDTPDHVMYERAKSGLSILADAGVPYALVPGNHDTGAVTVGGGACQGCSVPMELRNTTRFNQYFPKNTFPNITASYEPNSIDNAFHTFRAGGLDWGILSLELWPRTAVVNWAKGVLAAHPHHNVMVITHSHLSSSSAIEQSNGGYGANSPQYVYDQLYKVYPNVLFVFSGHVGTTGYRVDTGTNGNKVYSLLQCYHDEVTNPSRILEVDVAAGTVSSRVYGAWNNTTKNDGSQMTISNVQWVR